MKFVRLAIVCSLLWPFTGTTAQTIADYIKTWQNKSLDDSTRYFSLDEAAWNYAFSQPDSGYILANLQVEFTIQKKITDPNWVTRAYNNRSWACATAGNYAQAIEEQYKVLDISEKANFLKGIATAQSNLGQFHLQINQKQRALDFQLQAISSNQKLGDEDGLSRAYNNISMVYDALHENVTALQYLRLSMEIKKRKGDQQSIIMLHNNFANEYSQLNQLDSAIYFAKIAFDLTEKFPNEKQRTIASVNLANYYIKLEQYRQAYDYAVIGYDITLRTGSRSNRVYALLPLANALAGLGRKQEAIDRYKEHLGLKDSIMNEEAESNALKIAMKYEMKKRLETDSLKNAREKEITAIQNEQKLSQQKIYTYVALAGFLLLMGLAFISFKAYRQKKKDHHEITEQKKLVEEKQTEIVDSINYAKRIQSAILAKEEEILKYFPESFLLYKPKDIVAGDFYFFETTSTHLFYAAADCTGHGVPGALVSVVCSNALSRCVKEFGLTDPGQILDKARTLVIETFEKSGQEVKDGMDISLISLKFKDQSLKKNTTPDPQNPHHLKQETSNIELQWSGANNPLWLLKKDETAATEIKGDKQPIGQYTDPKPFTTHRLHLQSGDQLYLFTDGYADQFGGEKGKKFKYASLNKLLTEIRDQSAQEQLNLLRKKLENWQGDFEQTDDVCVIGIKL